jgi:hypothetical protein
VVALDHRGFDGGGDDLQLPTAIRPKLDFSTGCPEAADRQRRFLAGTPISPSSLAAGRFEAYIPAGASRGFFGTQPDFERAGMGRRAPKLNIQEDSSNCADSKCCAEGRLAHEKPGRHRQGLSGQPGHPACSTMPAHEAQKLLCR